MSLSSSSDTEDDMFLSSLSKRIKSVRVGSKLAKKFGRGSELFIGKITELPRLGERYYSVVYEDGDSETMLISEVLTCIDLFNERNK